MTATLTRTTRGLDTGFRDDFGSDTTANYWKSDGGSLSVASGAMSANQAMLAAPNNQCACVTAKIWRAASQYSSSPALIVARSGLKSALSGYGMFYRYSTTLWSLTRYDSGASTYLVTGANDKPAAATAEYVLCRLFHATGDVRGWGGQSWPLQNVLTSTDATYNANSLYDAISYRASSEPCDYIEGRPDYKISAVGLPTGYKLQANGSATYRATESGGTATLSVAVLEWPLTSVEVLDGANAQVVQLTATGYADMGGGDVFTYSAPTGGGFFNSFFGRDQ